MTHKKEDTEMCKEGRQCEETWGEDGHVQAKERGLEQILSSQPSGRTSSANTLILDFQPLEL